MSEAEEDVHKFLRRELPQIQIHGGEASVMAVDPDTGEVYLVLGSACSGCGLSPMTAEAIRRKMPEDIEWAEDVTIEFGGGFF